MMSESSKVLLRVLLGLLTVFILMTVVLLFFVDRVSLIEDRRKALLLAGQLLTRWESGEVPAMGVLDSVVIAGDTRFQIRRVVIECNPGIREMQLIISRDDRRSLELTRKFYDTVSNEMIEWRKI